QVRTCSPLPGSLLPRSLAVPEPAEAAPRRVRVLPVVRQCPLDRPGRAAADHPDGAGRLRPPAGPTAAGPTARGRRLAVGAEVPPPPLAGRHPARPARPPAHARGRSRAAPGGRRLLRPAPEDVRPPVAVAAQLRRGPRGGGRRGRQPRGPPLALRRVAEAGTFPPLPGRL